MAVTCPCVSRCHPASGSSNHPKRELMWEPALQRGPLWKNVHYVERNPNGDLVKGATGKPLCQELLIHITGPSGKLEYTPTDRGHPMPLTLATCHAEWDWLSWPYRNSDRDGSPPHEGRRTGSGDATQGGHHSQEEGGCERPRGAGEHRYQLSRIQPVPGWPATGRLSWQPLVHLSDATDASASGSCP